MYFEKVILVPGLGDREAPLFFKGLWKLWGVSIITFQTRWKSQENFRNKLVRLVELIDKESKDGPISLIGTSAGGSLVVNAYLKRKGKINKVLGICSRLHKGKIKGFSGFEQRTRGYSAFAESVVSSEKAIKCLGLEDRQKIMTTSGWIDELVPHNTSRIEGVKHATVPTIEHVIGIMSSLTLFSRPIRGFLFQK